jgi:hypothetical protein
VEIKTASLRHKRDGREGENGKRKLENGNRKGEIRKAEIRKAEIRKGKAERGKRKFGKRKEGNPEK